MVLIIISTALALSGCGSEKAGSGRSVVASFYPLAYAAERVAPGAVVENLTPAGAEPHDIELSARDVERVNDADLVLYLGNGFMPALEDAVQGHANAIDLLAGMKLRAATEAHDHGDEDHADEEEHAEEDAQAEEEERGLDPHVWLDPIRYAQIVQKTANALGEPEAAAELVAELEELHTEFREGLATCERREIVTSHAAFGYLAEAYDLEEIALTGVSPEAEPSARDIESLIDEVREHGATTVFFETLVSPKLAETVAREADATTAVLDPLEGPTAEEIEQGADYFSIMRENLAALRQALGCS
jgi:zinc transport system substrate-binding protein